MTRYKIAWLIVLVGSVASAAQKKVDPAVQGVISDFRAMRSALKVGINCPAFHERIVNLQIKIDEAEAAESDAPVPPPGALRKAHLNSAMKLYKAHTALLEIQAVEIRGRCPDMDVLAIYKAIDSVIVESEPTPKPGATREVKR
jgi:hypothetical protein